MNLIRERTTTLLVAVALAGGLSACKSRDQYASTDTLTRSDSAAGSAMTTRDTTYPLTDTTKKANAPMTTNTSSAWNDASILGYARAANSNEVALGQLAETKATSAAVKAFARQMVTDHRKMLNETEALGKRVKITADMTTGDAKDALNDGRDQLKDLTEKTAGTDWDKNFMDKMIDGHQKVLDKLNDAVKNTTNADIKTALTKAVGKVQQHLTKAQDIKANTLKA